MSLQGLTATPTWDDVEILLGMTESSLSHVQLKNGTVVEHLPRNISSKLKFFINIKVLNIKIEGFKPIVYHLNKKKQNYFTGFGKNCSILYLANQNGY